MAEINTTINLRDGMSQPLRHMIKAMNVLVSTVQSVASKTKSPIDAKALMTARSELARASLLIDKMGTEAVQTTQATRNMATATSNVAQAANGVSKTWTLTQRQIAKIDKITTEIALSENSRAAKLAEIAKLRKAEEADQGKIKTLELQIKNLLAGEEVKRQNIWKIIDNSAKAAGKLSNESVRQEILSNRLAASKAKLATLEAVGAEKVRKAEELTNNARLQGENIKKRGLNIELQGENIKKRGAALDEAAASRAARKASQEEKVRRKLLEQERIKRIIGFTEAMHAGAVAKVTQKYEAAKQKVLELERSTKRYTQAGKYELKNARDVAALRQKILNDTNKLVSVRARLNVLENQGKSTGLQALIVKRQERSLKEQIARSSSKIVSIERQLPPIIRQATAAQNQHNAAIRQGASESSMLWSKMKSMAGAYIGVQTVGSLINTADSLAANDARLNLMVKEGETAQQISDEIYAAAMRSRSGYMAMADSVAKVGIQAGNLFSSSSEMVRFMETFNKMAVISKANSQQTNAAMTQLIQALSFGQLRGDELKSILENMPMVAHALADELTRMGDSFFDTLPDKLKHIAADGKVTADEIRALGYEGQLSSETVVNAMLNGSEKIDKMAKNMTWTWGQVWEVFKNAALRAFTPIFNGISKIIQTERFKRFAEWVDGAMTRVANAAKDLWSTASPIIADIFDGIAKIGNFIGNNWSFIAPIIWGIVGALTAYSVAVKIATIWTAIHKGTVFLAGIATAIFTKLTMAERIAKMKATAAQWGFNKAVYACPVTWIIVALIVLIVIIYLVVAAINEMTGASISATGIICGAVMWLGSVIWDIIAWLINVIIGSIFALAVIIANIVIGIMNLISGVVQVIVNSWQWCCDNIGIIFDNIGIWWTNMWADCYIFFCDFITKVINKLASLAEYVQPIAEVLGMDIAGKLNKIKKGVSDAREGFASQKKEYKSLKSFKDVNWTSVDYLSVGDAWDTGYNMLGYLDAGKAWDKGYDWGKGVENKFNGLMSGKSLDDLSKVGDLDKKLKQGDFSKALGGGFDDPKTGNGAKAVRNPALDKIGKNTDKIADSTGQTAENTSKDDEYFKYLRRAGERHSMNRQQLLNFKVDMSNVNHIKSGLDYDEMMRRLARELYQQVVSKMDGAISY